MLALLSKVHHPDRAPVPQSPGPSRVNLNAGGDVEHDALASSPATSTYSSAGTSSSGGEPAPRRQLTTATSPNDQPKGATPMGDDSYMACLGEGIAQAVGSRSSQAPAFASFAEIEQEHFCPLLIETNAALR